jgi:glycosyltransferase involved in cell wall biosynthesis
MISVIIPCYNAERTLAATIASALNQDADKEVIVVNDGSTDSSAKIIGEFGDRIRSLSLPNGGASFAREIGTKLARGDYVQYLDSDDLLAPATLSARLEAIATRDADIAHTDWQKLERGPDGDFVLGDIIKPNLAAIRRDAEVATATSEFWAPPAALLYRRDVVERIGGWPVGLPVIQDARYLFEAARHKARFTYVPGVGAYYRVLPDSLSRRNLARFITDCARNASEIEAIWREEGTPAASRVDALAGIWAHVAKAALLNGLDEFEVARLRHNRFAPRRTLFEAGCLLRRVIGARAAASILEGARQSKRMLRQCTALIDLPGDGMPCGRQRGSPCAWRDLSQWPGHGRRG